MENFYQTRQSEIVGSCVVHQTPRLSEIYGLLGKYKEELLCLVTQMMDFNELLFLSQNIIGEEFGCVKVNEYICYEIKLERNQYE